MNKTKSLTSLESVDTIVRFLKESCVPFRMSVSNYTIQIESDLKSYQFMQSFRSNQCFAGFMKIKSDVTGKDIPVLEKYGLQYYSHDFKEDFKTDDVFAVDITSAYATQLFNAFFIKPETYAYINAMPKQDRLAAIGMLASNKYEFEYDSKGELKSFNHITSQLENFFFYCVKNISSIMNDIKKLIGNDYLYSWVDCVYLKNNRESLKIVEMFLQSINTFYTVELLHKFDVKILNERVAIGYWKKKRTKEGYPFYKNIGIKIPNRSNQLAEDIVSFIIQKNIKNEKVNSLQNPGRDRFTIR